MAIACDVEQADSPAVGTEDLFVICSGQFIQFNHGGFLCFGCSGGVVDANRIAAVSSDRWTFTSGSSLSWQLLDSSNGAA